MMGLLKKDVLSIFARPSTTGGNPKTKSRVRKETLQKYDKKKGHRRTTPN